MKQSLLLLLFLFTIVATAQDYKKNWDKVIEYEREGKTKTAAGEAALIYAMAKKDKNEGQVIKTFFFTSKYIQALEEDAQAKIVKNLLKEIAGATPPTKALLHSIYAEILYSIYNHNRYNISQRTNTDSIVDNSMLIWTGKNYEAAISTANKRSLENREILYKTPLDTYKDIIEYNLMSPQTNRSLYDFLAERHLFYINHYYEYVGIYGLKDNLSLLYADNGTFQKIKIDSLPDALKDGIAFCLQTEQFYTSKKDTTSLYRATLRRLDYINRVTSYSSYGPDDNNYYLNTLQEFIKAWKNNPFAYHAKLNLAKFYSQAADKKNHPDYNSIALELCNDIIKNSRHNDVAPDALLLRNSILNHVATITIEQYVVPDKPILALVNFKNISSLKISIYRIDALAKRDKELYKSIIKNRRPLTEKLYTLPVKEGYFDYSTEIILPALPGGRYIIVASEDSKDAKLFDISTIQAANIALVKQYDDKVITYQVLNRETGAPVKKAGVFVTGKKLNVDSNARVTVKPIVPKDYNPKAVPAQKSNNDLDMLVIYQADTITSKHYNDFSKRNYSQDNEFVSTAVAQVFLDRAIYRPGQTLYFKGIITEKTKNGIATVPNIYASVTIEDAANKIIKTFRLKTNEFGSLTGEFALPKNGLTGEFEITIDEDEDPEKDPLYNKVKDEHPFWDNVEFQNARLYFNVEEYKRPTFNVIFEKVTQDYRLNQEASIAGIAKSYSGAPVAGAKVTYSVSRTSTMTRWDYNTENNNQNNKITDGEAITDAEGKFVIKYALEPNPDLPKEGLPVFSYSIYADVSDVNGETHNARSIMQAGYHSLKLEASHPDIIKPENKENIITLTSTNLNGQFLPVDGLISIHKVAAPGGIYRDRYWRTPEIQQIAKADFKKNFPYLNYEGTKKDTVIYSKTVYTKAVNTGKTKTISLTDFSGWPSGKYELVFTAKDSADNAITSKSSFELVRDTDTYLPDNKFFDHEILNKNFIKDGFIKVSLRSALPVLFINVVAEARENKFNKDIIIKDGRTIVKIPVTKNDTRIEIGLSYIWQNRLSNDSFTVTIPQEEEILAISATSINNKLQPGGQEQWSFTIGAKNKLPSEVLASMYDTSLDNFATTEWMLYSPEDDRNYRASIPYRNMDEGTIKLRFNSYYDNSGYSIKNFEHRLNTYGFNIIKSKYDVSPKQIVPALNTRKDGTFIISGTISDQSGPLPGANIVIKDSEQGVQADFDGAYAIPVKLNDVLVFSFVGLKTTEIQVTSARSIDVVLEEDGLALEDIVIDKYRTTTSKSTAAATTIIVEEIEDRANASVLQSLQGQVAGLDVEYGNGQPGSDTKIILRGVGSINGNIEPLFVIDGIPVDEDGFRSINQSDIAAFTVLKDAAATSLYGSRGANGVIVITTKKGKLDAQALQQVQTRKNFNETAFFYPQLTTDKEGNLTFNFTTPESLTEWKLRLLAHNKKGVSGYFESIAMTQKDIMVVPNMPRFLRENDTITLTAKITNITAQSKTGTALLQLFDAVTMEPADALMLNIETSKPFLINAKASTTVSWKVVVPAGLQAVQYKVVAKAGNFTDGEENILPVLTNRVLITESLPIWVKPVTTKQYTFENLKNNTSGTLRHQGITLEYTSNPAWLALQSLPYLMEYEHECAEQVFARYYANAIAANVVNSNPKIAEVFSAWRKQGKPVSKLVQNEELKSIITAESPWLLDTQSEEEKNNRLALLFDLDKLKNELGANLRKLEAKQLSSGGFAWFDGGEENEYITRHILAGLGHLKITNAVLDGETVNEIAKSGLAYIDMKFLENYKIREVRSNRTKRVEALQSNTLHYLYARSFYNAQFPADKALSNAVKAELEIVKQSWLTSTLYEKGLAALALYRFGDTVAAEKIMASLKETSANNEEWGMYWIDNKAGWYWYTAPIETQALLIEAFTEISKDIKSADAMKVWLIKNKQNKNWPTTKATTEAIYALMLKGSDWISVQNNTVIKAGDEKVLANKLAESKKEAATGYVKLNWKPEEVSVDLATVTIENKSAVPGFGGFYWQYFDDLEKIKISQGGVMTVAKELYIKKNSAGAPQLHLITAKNMPKVGDIVTIRLVIIIKEDVEYIHLKDMRASSLEPVDVLSGYHRKDGLDFYQSTRDAATHFFFDRIAKGTYVLEYDVKINNAGDFSNGISTIQSMYAPEFSAHTKGLRFRTE